MRKFLYIRLTEDFDNDLDAWQEYTARLLFDDLHIGDTLTFMPENTHIGVYLAVWEKERYSKFFEAFIKPNLEDNGLYLNEDRFNQVHKADIDGAKIEYMLIR